MKNILKDVVLFTILSISFIYIFNNNLYISKMVIYSVDIWLTKIVPALFPTFIIVDIIYYSKIPYYIKKHLHINYIYILSIISGSPSNAYILNKYNINVTKLLAVTKYSSFVFTYNYLKIIFNNRIAIILIIINVITNIIMIIIIKPPKIEYDCSGNKNIFSVILESISKNINVLISILGTIIFFNILPINLIDNVYIKSLLFSVLEITSSFNNLSVVNISIGAKLLFAIISMSTCGLCIECQIKSIISDTSLNYKEYFKYRLYHLVIFMGIAYITLLL